MEITNSTLNCNINAFRKKITFLLITYRRYVASIFKTCFNATLYTHSLHFLSAPRGWFFLSNRTFARLRWVIFCV